MSMTLSDAFNRRKKIEMDLATWTQRLAAAGRDRRELTTKELEGSAAFVPEPGSEKVTRRAYSIEECRTRIGELLTEDRALAVRISLTNQRAMSTVKDLDGSEREMSIPEMLVLKNDIIPKLEAFHRAVPTRAEGVNVYLAGEGFIGYRDIKKLEKKRESITDKGIKMEETVVTGYRVEEIKDYGVPQRESWNEIDRIHDFAQRVKQAINEANKTPLI
jgi:hypothetical protein